MMRAYGWMWNENARESLGAAEWEDWSERARHQHTGRSWVNGVLRIRKAQVREAGPECILHGWQPTEPIIDRGSRVLAMGSCFAAYFVEWLSTNGYNQALGKPGQALACNAFENISAVAQQFRWAFGEVDPANLSWIDKQKERNYATEDKREGIRQSLLDADVLIVTLSISEIWYDKVTGEPLCRIMPAHYFDPERHAFKVLSLAETMEGFTTIERIRARWLPKLRIVYTVSPQPIAMTFRDISPITANSASKAILRAALDEFLRSRGGDLNKVYFYFPGYELVQSLLSNPFIPDNRHLQTHIVDLVLDVFAGTYTSTGRELALRSGDSVAWPEADEGTKLATELETQNEQLQSICDQRLKVIEELKRTCDERLKLINALELTCDERLELIESLNRTCDQRLEVIEQLSRPQLSCDERKLGLA